MFYEFNSTKTAIRRVISSATVGTKILDFEQAQYYKKQSSGM